MRLLVVENRYYGFRILLEKGTFRREEIEGTIWQPYPVGSWLCVEKLCCMLYSISLPVLGIWPNDEGYPPRELGPFMLVTDCLVVSRFSA